MKIAIIGYGKMGKEIESVALANRHEVVIKIDSANLNELNKDNLKHADVAIEFTRPESAAANIMLCLDSGIPVITGTTGWYEQLPLIKEKCTNLNGSFLYASNFSIGVQVFFMVNKTLAAIMNKLPEYEVTIEEIHHLQKLDSPSGTAITLANAITDVINRKSNWQNEITPDPSDKNTLFIKSVRAEKVIGIHTVNYESLIDKISITHEAKNRKGFASGAIEAAIWLKDKKGFYNMDDFMKDYLN